VAGKARSSAVTAIVGTDSYRAEQVLEERLSAAVGSDRTDAVQVFRGEETTWTRVIDAARTRSLFVAKRAVVVRAAEGLKGEGDDLAAYLEDPTPGVALLLVAAKPDKRRTAWKRLLERAEVVSADPLKGRELRAYVADQLRRRKLTVTDDGLNELIERVGQDLRRLMGEIEKLEAFGSAKPLTADEVAQVLGRGLARPLYRLSDALIGRDAARALELMDEILDEGEAPVLVLGTLHRALRQVRGAQALRQARADWGEAAARLRVPPFKVGDLMKAAGAWSETQLRRAFEAVGRADRRVKTGGDPRVALTVAVAEALAGRPSGKTAAPGGPRPGPPGR
jgi:DNA polymerase-3 subunit delta